MSLQIVKATFGSDTRRFSVAKSAPLSDLLSLIRSTFGISPDAKVTVNYVDDENDQCTLTADDELLEAFRVASGLKGGILRLQVSVDGSLPQPTAVPVSVKGKEPATEAPKEPEAAAPAEDQSVLESARAALEGFLKHVVEGGRASIQPDWLNDAFNNALSAWGGLVGLIHRAEEKVLDPNLIKDIVDDMLKNDKIREVAAQLEVLPKEQLDEEKAKAASAAEAAAAEAAAASAAPPAGADAAAPPPWFGTFQQQMGQWMEFLAASPFAQFLNAHASHFASAPQWGRPYPPAPAPFCPMAATTVPPPVATTGSTTHPCVTCDGCHQRIVGVRYKCTNCEDFDFCATCEATVAHDETHAFLKLNRPVLHGLGRGPLLPNYYGGAGGAPFVGRFGGRCGRHFRQCQAQSAAAAAAAPKTVPVTSTAAAPVPEATPAPVATPVVAPAPVAAAPLDMVDDLNAAFVEHRTIGDDQELGPQTQFVKIWRLRNNGTAQWPAGTTLEFVGGDLIGAQSVAVPAALPSGEVDVAVEMTAPREPGRYAGYWRLRAGDRSFGQRVHVCITVVAPTEPQPETPREPEEGYHTIYPSIDCPGVDWSAPKAAAAAPPAPVEETPFTILAAMGFTDTARITELLQRHNGDLEAVVNALI